MLKQHLPNIYTPWPLISDINYVDLIIVCVCVHARSHVISSNIGLLYIDGFTVVVKVKFSLYT